ncbi:MAG: hypothetical protein ACE15D_12120 [Candidatus Eisenbacteria bacterium]
MVTPRRSPRLTPRLKILAPLALLLGGLLGGSGAVAPQASDAAALGSHDPPSRLKVLGLSLLVPGLGHRALGRETRGAIFLGTEAGIWGGFGVFEVQSHLRKDSYIEMAELFAGVKDASGHSDEYYRQLGRYPSSDWVDDEVRRDARALYPDDLPAREDYYQRHRVPEDQRWSWSSTAEWDRYRAKRSDSQQASKRANYMLGIAVANRLVAAIDAVRIANNQGKEPAMGLILSADPRDPELAARIGLALRFR